MSQKNILYKKKIVKTSLKVVQMSKNIVQMSKTIVHGSKIIVEMYQKKSSNDPKIFETTLE